MSRGRRCDAWKRLGSTACDCPPHCGKEWKRAVKTLSLGGARSRHAAVTLSRRAATTENLLPAILAAVEAYATVGEISDALRRVFGEYQEAVVL